MHCTATQLNPIDQLQAEIAILDRKMLAIDRLLQRRERYLEALDWSAMTVSDLEQADWRGQELHRDLWMLDTAQNDAFLELWGHSG